MNKSIANYSIYKLFHIRAFWIHILIISKMCIVHPIIKRRFVRSLVLCTSHNEVNSMGPNKNELVLCINTYLSIFSVFLLSFHFVSVVHSKTFSSDFPNFFLFWPKNEKKKGKMFTVLPFEYKRMCACHYNRF